MLYFPKLNILNHGFYGLRDFTVFGGRFSVGFEVLAAGVLNQDLQDFEYYKGRLRFKHKGNLLRITLYPYFRRCVTHRRKASI